jgi:hypothetical protein
VLARALREASGEHVLLAGARAEEATLFSAALGCSVTTLTAEAESLERMFAAADAAGVGSQVRGCVCELGAWDPDVPLRVVVCAPDAFEGVAVPARGDAIRGLQRATPIGGVHLMLAGQAGEVSLDEWRGWYAGWAVSAEDRQLTEAFEERTYVARRVPAADGVPAA